MIAEMRCVDCHHRYYLKGSVDDFYGEWGRVWWLSLGLKFETRSKKGKKCPSCESGFAYIEESLERRFAYLEESRSRRWVRA